MYAPQFAPLNAVLPPPTWFSVCIFFMEIFAIGFPIIDVVEGYGLRQETLEAIANWEKRQVANGIGSDRSLLSPSAFSNATTLKSTGALTATSKGSMESQKSDMLTMTALENALRSNAIPLLTFAALKDFSGENVSFLTHVADWRRGWFLPQPSTVEHRHKQFVAAVRIYARFISLEFSEFPINISSKEMKRLYQIFSSAARLLYDDRYGSIVPSTSDNATPFDTVLPEEAHNLPVDCKSSYDSRSELRLGTTLDTLGRANFRSVSHVQVVSVDEAMAHIKIPEDFTEMVFDLAESEIKYLVLTNTWPRFVNIGRANSQMDQDMDEEKGGWWARGLLRSL
jgi:hypothetical protein